MFRSITILAFFLCFPVYLPAGEESYFPALCFLCFEGFIGWFVIMPIMSGLVMTYAELAFLFFANRKLLSSDYGKFILITNIFSSAFVIVIFTFVGTVFGSSPTDFFYFPFFLILVGIAWFFSLKYKCRKLGLKIPRNLSDKMSVENFVAFFPSVLAIIFNMFYEG